MHSSRPDCVLGEARLISSTSTTLANTGPGRNSKRSSRWLKTLVPTTSAGRRSGVHCPRAKPRAAARARKAGVARARERAREGRLADAGEVLDEDVALGEDAHEQVVEDLGADL